VKPTSEIEVRSTAVHAIRDSKAQWKLENINGDFHELLQGEVEVTGCLASVCLEKHDI
jgi:hypothetical protein